MNNRRIKMTLPQFKKYLKAQGCKAKSKVVTFKGIYAPIPQAMYVWGDGCEEAAKLAKEMGYKVEKEKSFKRYEITYA